MRIGIILLLALVACFVCVRVISTPVEVTTQGDRETIEYGNPPEPYYISTPQQYGIDALKGYLQGKEWNTDYEADVFDCTEMSAFLERWLENKGFHAYIVGGELDNDPHAWVRVEAVPQIYVIVEATALRVITPGNARYNKYRETHQYETIYDALKVSQSAYDWWK